MPIRSAIQRLAGVRFIRFIAVGMLNTAVGYGLYVVFILCGLSYQVAALFSTVLGVLFNFFSTGRLVFGSSRPRAGMVIRFVAVYVLIYFTTIYIIKGALALGCNAISAGFFSLPVTVVMAYILQKTFVFRKGRP